MNGRAHDSTEHRVLLNAIRATIPAAIHPVLTAGPDGSDLFELFLATRVASVARTASASVHYEDSAGVTVSNLHFRTSPGPFLPPNPYTHFVLDFGGGHGLELHLGARIVGRAGVANEYDLALIHRSAAERCRQRRIPPKTGKVEWVGEAKFYSNTLGIGVARAFVGLARDTTAKQRATLLTSNSLSCDAAKLLAGHNLRWDELVVPGSAAVAGFDERIREVLRVFRAK